MVSVLVNSLGEVNKVYMKVRIKLLFLNFDSIWEYYEIIQ